MQNKDLAARSKFGKQRKTAGTENNMRSSNTKVATLSSETREKSFLALVSVFACMVALILSLTSQAYGQSSVRPPASAVENNVPEAKDGKVPGNTLGINSDSDTWRAIRHGVTGNVSIVDKKAGILVQSDGENFRLLRNGPLFSYLGLLMLATLILLSIFFAIRGRIRVESGMSGRKILRFNTVERMGHWLMAVSFIILGISGLNVTFGKAVIMPIIGKEAFGPMSAFLKITHNYVAFAFMLGLAIAFLCWVVHNLPSRHDINWILKGGGLFTKGSHPPAKKFNAGQKIIFWSVMLGGLSLCFSGWALLFPFEYNFFSSTFSMLSAIGINVPALIGLGDPPYTVIQEQQYNAIWHAIVAVLMICLIFAHIYIGSIGMEGAYDAMGSGEVDENWAKEHHSLWVEEVKDQQASDGERTNIQPAE